MPWTPHALPFLLQQFGSATRAQTRFMRDALTHVTVATSVPPSFERAAVRDRMISDFVHNAALYWMDAEVCTLVRETAPGLPDWTPEELAPKPCGVIAFEKQTLTYPDPNAGATVELNVDAIGWQTVDGQLTVHALSLRRGARRPHESTLLTSVARVAPQIPLPPRADIASALTDVYNVTISLVDTVRTDGSVSMTPENAGWSATSGLAATGMTMHSPLYANLLHTLGATWALLRQREVLTPTEPAISRVRIPREPASPNSPGAGIGTGTGAGTGAGSGNRRQLVQVNIYRLSPELIGHPGGTPGAGGHGPAIRRWWVRGHWRRQPWGKKLHRRKLVYILPHTAGAHGVDVEGQSPDERTSVTVVRL